MGARGGPCPGGGTLLRAGWQEAGLPRGHSARPGVRLLTEAASKVLHIQDRKTQRLQAKPRVPPHTHIHSARGRGPQGIPGGEGPCPVQPGCRQAVLGADMALVWFHVQWSLRRKAGQIQPLKAPGAAGDRAVGVGRGVGPTGRQRGQSGQLAVPGEWRRGP